ASEVVPEDYARLARLAAEEGNFEEALRLTREARRASPSSARLAVDEAYFLSQSGDDDAAARLLEETLEKEPDAEGMLMLARILVRRPERLADAGAWAARALRTNAAALLEIERDPDLRAVAALPDVHAAMSKARRMLG
ncbi:MAG TPA: tetratricopeptide repeat protein, partial [Candidatus Thermoplasmatota archaeon]|nr:tetratricopeptide repeat protein [Candidatus Thermoplasmatota archaeon]